MTLVTLCMIVRNEGKMLEDCLSSVQGVVDEIVIVDTGSSDNTVEIANKFGATVLVQPWADDFSAPRNLALSRATGRFVLQLDADERLARPTGLEVRRAAERSDFDCALLPLRNARSLDDDEASVLSGAKQLGETMHLPRLFRRSEGLRFEGVVHECITRHLVETNGRIVFLPADIIHYGATAALRDQRGKAARNVGLLEKRIAQDPNDQLAHAYLASELVDAGEEEQAFVACEKGWKLFLRDQGERKVSVLRLAVLRAMLEQRRGNPLGSLETIAAAERNEGPHPDLDFLRGSAHELVALSSPGGSRHQTLHLEAALSAHRAAVSRSKNLYAQRFITGAAGSASQERLGTVALLAGRLEEAKTAFDAALVSAPTGLAPKLGIAEIALRRRDATSALDQLIPLLADEPEAPDAWTLAALACECASLLDTALGLARRARLRLSKGFMAPHRKYELLALMGRLAAYEGKPTGGGGIEGALGSLMARQPFEPDAQIGLAADSRRVERLVLGLMAAKRSELLDPLLSARAEVAFPGIGKAVRDALALVGASVEDDGVASPIMVIAPTAAEAAFVAALLLAQQHEPATPAGLPMREIESHSPSSFAQVKGGIAFATLLFVDSPMLQRPAEHNGRVALLNVGELLADPVSNLGKLFAAIDMPSGSGGLRYLIENYPGSRATQSATTFKKSFVRSRA